MKKLDWYIIKKFIGTFIYAIALIIVIVIVFDVSEKIKDFIENKAPLSAIVFDYYVNFIPFFVNMFSALFTFIAVIFFTSRMAASSEFVAILASGISFRRILVPYIITVVFIGILNLYLANFLIPDVNKKRMEFERKYVLNQYYNRNTNIHFQFDDTTFYYTESFDNSSKQGVGYRFTEEKIDPDKGLIQKISAESIRYDTAAKMWTLYNYFIRDLDSLSEHIQSGYETRMTLPIVPEDFAIDFADISEMNYSELKAFIDREKLRGSNNLKAYEYEQKMRVSHPLATIIMMLIGVAISSRKVRGGVGLHLAIGISIAFLFIFFLQLSRVFATFGNFPVWLAAWLSIFVFGLVALVLLRITPK